MKNYQILKRELNLLFELTLSRFKLRHKDSILYLLWYLINPIILMAVIYIIFSSNIGSQINYFSFYVLIGIVHWNFFSVATLEGMMSLNQYSMVVKKTNCSRILLVLSAVFSILIKHLIQMLILITIIVFTTGISYSIAVIPFITLLETVLACSISLWLSSAVSYVKDIESIWRNILFIGWFLTPIFYLKSMIPSVFGFINSINPLTYVLDYSRLSLIYKTVPNMNFLVAAFIVVVLFFILSYLVFKRLIVNVAERI